MAVQSQGRLTLTSGTPYLASDVTSATTVYFTPALGNEVPIWNGAVFTSTPFSEVSQALSDTTYSPAAAAASSLYDMFVWTSGGAVIVSRGPAWSSATSRGTGAGTTELQFVNGVYTNKNAITNGPAAGYGTYVGTISTDASTTLNMMFAPAAASGGSDNRLDVWNMYNRSLVSSRNIDSKTTWTYTTETWRAKDGSSGNACTFVLGMPDVMVQADNHGNADSSTSNGQAYGIGLDSTSANHADTGFEWTCVNSGKFQGDNAFWSGLPGLGSHYLCPLEIAQTGGTATWFGTGTASGLHLWGNSVFRIILPM
ncbi:MAG TPA: hypothetical protein VK779_08440 [Rhizomicrobium sp.]|jgi:hypothetical protein|nr:hypothetical protein [Rhizomicrobium sp.]